MRRSRATKDRRKSYGVYARVSTDEQAKKDFTSVEVQIDLCKAYVVNKGGKIEKVYHDDGETGTIINRPGLKQMLTDIEAGLVNVVVATYLHRLGRGDAATVADAVSEADAVFDVSLTLTIIEYVPPSE